MRVGGSVWPRMKHPDLTRTGPPVPVAVSIRVQAETGGCAHLDECERAGHGGERREEAGAATRLVRLREVRTADAGDVSPVRGEPLCESGEASDRSAEVA